MEKKNLHNKFKLLKLYNFFTSACQNQNISQVIDHNKNPIFTPQNTNFLKTPLLNKIQNDEEPKHPFSNFVNKPEPEKINSPSLRMCKPKCRQTYNMATNGNTFPRRKVTGRYSMFSPSGDFSCRKCPPGSSASPPFQKQGNKENKKKNNPMSKEKATHIRKNGFKPNPFSFSSSSEDADNGDWFSSDDEREDYEKQTMFSLKSVSFSSKSISLSSDSDNQIRTQIQTRTRSQPRRRKTGSKVKEVGVVLLEGKVKDTLAIVKQSSDDPYNDFRKIQGQGQTQTLTQTRPRRRKAGSRAKKMGVMPLEGNVKGIVAIVKSSSDPYNDSRNIQGPTPTQTQTQITRPRRRKTGSRVKEVGVVPLEVRAKDTFAIVKSSSDPYNDFWKSMVEMIMEKQIFGAKELEQLLECFLFLNSFHHHHVIVEVFREICDALFCHCS